MNPDTPASVVERPTLPVRERLALHLKNWLGAWPPVNPPEMIVWPGRDIAGWDGISRWPMIGVASPHGTLLSLSPAQLTDLNGVDPAALTRALAEMDLSEATQAMSWTNLTFSRIPLRWSEHPVELPSIGEWVKQDDPRIPDWLCPFNGGILVSFGESGQFASGVGIKRHNRFGYEIAISTEPDQRGKGLARMLVAQSARHILARGGVPLYMHEPGNVASARVAEAAGFPDRGWRVIELSA